MCYFKEVVCIHFVWALSPNNFNSDNGNDNSFIVNDEGRIDNNNVDNSNNGLRVAISV